MNFKFRLLLVFLISCFILSCTKNSGIFDLVRNSYSPGSFEIYMIPDKYNTFFYDDLYYDKWKSHIPVNGKYEYREHRGAQHGLPYAYDTHIPIILFGEKYIEQAESFRKVYIDEIVPTLAGLLKIDFPPYTRGKALFEAVKSNNKKRPKIIVVFVVDQGGWIYFNNQKGNYPFIKSMMQNGLVFNEAYLNYGPSATGVSHAVIGTGVLPKYSGVYENKPYRSGVFKKYDIYKGPQGYDVLQSNQPTLADYWDVLNENKSLVLSYCSVERAAIGMGGHGAEFRGGDKDNVFWYSSTSQKFVTEEKLFSLPESIKDMSFKKYQKLNKDYKYWSMQSCNYRGEDNSFWCLKGSPAFTKLEGDAVFTSLENGEFGKDDVTDLVFVTFKATDYCGHYLGSESLECGETFKQIDTQIERIYKMLNKRTDGDMVTLITADHGVAPLTEFSGGSIVLMQTFVKQLEKHFDKTDNGMPVVNEIYPTMLSLNLAELRTNGFNLKDVKEYLMQYKVDNKPFFKQVITYKEVENY